MSDDTVIIAVAGRKQSGKSSLCEFLRATMAAGEHNRDDAGTPAGLGEGPMPYVGFVQRPTGEIDWHAHDCVFAGLGDRGKFRSERRPIDFAESQFLRLNEGPATVYNFADSLKQAVIDLLGVSREACYGTDEQKNQPTHLLWDSLPMYVRWVGGGKRVRNGTLPPTSDELSDEMAFTAAAMTGLGPTGARAGPMTGREVMQVFGTDVMRRMFHNDVWVNATLARIRRDRPKVALIADMRFRTEFHALHAAGAFVVRLDRQITHDTHASEVDLDGFPFEDYPRTLRVTADADLHEKNRRVTAWLGRQLPHVFGDTSE